MAKKLYPESAVQDIADAIRAKNGSSETYTIEEMAQAIRDIPAGGGGEVEKKDVNFYDIDGKRLYSYTKEEYLALDELPVGPEKEVVVFKKWNWSRDKITSYVTKYGKCDNIAAIYGFADGDNKSYFIVDLPEGVTDLEFGIFAPYGRSYKIDWGNGEVWTLLGETWSNLELIPHGDYFPSGRHIISIEGDFTADPYYNNDSFFNYSFIHSTLRAPAGGGGSGSGSGSGSSSGSGSGGSKFIPYDKYLKGIFLNKNFIADKKVTGHDYVGMCAYNLDYLVIDNNMSNLMLCNSETEVNIKNCIIKRTVSSGDTDPISSTIKRGEGGAYTHIHNLTCECSVESGDLMRLGNLSALSQHECENAIFSDSILLSSDDIYLQSDTKLKFVSLGSDSNYNYHDTQLTAAYIFGNSNAKIESITIPEGIVSLGKNLITGKRYLNQLLLPESIVSLGEECIYGNVSLYVVDFGYTSITDPTILGLLSETAVKIILPNTLTSVRFPVALTQSTTLRYMVFKSTTPPACSLGTEIRGLTIEVPQGHLNDYKTASNYPDPDYNEYIES